jgi:putative endonuclease
MEHNAGVNKSCFTYNRRPVELKFQQEFLEVNQAIYFEKKIKKWSRAKKKALIEGNYHLLPILAECRNYTHYRNKPGEN